MTSLLLSECLFPPAKAALTCKQHAKELLLKQKECNITINGMKRVLQSGIKRKDKMSSAVLQKRAAKLRVIIKRHKMDNATSKVTICNLEEKVATFDATLEQLKRSHENALIDLEQLKRSHENALIDLTMTHRSEIRSIHSQHFSSLLTEKQKLRLHMVNERQLQKNCTMKCWMPVNMQEMLASQHACPIISSH